MSADSSSTITETSTVDLNSLDTTQVHTFREFLANFNRVSEICFKNCIFDFKSRSVNSTEDKCTQYCVEKYLKANQRISQRFQEAQLQAYAAGGGNPLQ